jgi:hypothetical protein
VPARSPGHITPAPRHDRHFGTSSRTTHGSGFRNGDQDPGAHRAAGGPERAPGAARDRSTGPARGHDHRLGTDNRATHGSASRSDDQRAKATVPHSPDRTGPVPGHDHQSGTGGSATHGSTSRNGDQRPKAGGPPPFAGHHGPGRHLIPQPKGSEPGSDSSWRRRSARTPRPPGKGSASDPAGSGSAANCCPPRPRTTRCAGWPQPPGSSLPRQRRRGRPR